MRLNSDGTIELTNSGTMTWIMGGMKPQDKKMRKAFKQVKKKAMKAWNDLIK